MQFHVIDSGSVQQTHISSENDLVFQDTNTGLGQSQAVNLLFRAVRFRQLRISPCRYIFMFVKTE